MLPTLDICLDEKEAAAFEQRCAAFPALLEAAARNAEKKTRGVLRRHVNQKLGDVAELPSSLIRRSVTARQRSGAQEVRVASGQIPLIRYKITPLIPVPPQGVASATGRASSTSSARAANSTTTRMCAAKTPPGAHPGSSSTRYAAAPRCSTGRKRMARCTKSADPRCSGTCMKTA